MPIDPDLAAVCPFVYAVMNANAQRGPLAFGSKQIWQAGSYNLWHCLDGTIEVASPRGRLRVGPGGVVLTEPGSGVVVARRSRANRLVFDILVRARRRLDRDRNKIIPVDPRPQPGWSELFATPPPDILPPPALPAVIRLMVDIRECYWRPGGQMRANAMLHAWLADQLARPPHAESILGFADRVDLLIDQGMRDGVTLDIIAARLGCSQGTLVSHYRRERNETPGAGYERLRRSRAERLLATGVDRVARIAAHCGFASNSAFTYWFRHAVGCTPTAWRRKSGLPRT